MMYKFEETIEKLLREKRMTKKSLYEHLGLTRQGFDQKLKNGTVSVIELGMMAHFFETTEANLIAMLSNKEVIDHAPTATFDGWMDYLRTMEDRFMNLIDQLNTKDSQIKAKDNQIATLLELLGKPEGAIVQPLYPGMMPFEKMMRQYKEAVLGPIRTYHFFLAQPVAKLVAPRCL